MRKINNPGDDITLKMFIDWIAPKITDPEFPLTDEQGNLLVDMVEKYVKHLNDLDAQES